MTFLPRLLLGVVAVSCAKALPMTLRSATMVLATTTNRTMIEGVSDRHLRTDSFPRVCHDFTEEFSSFTRSHCECHNDDHDHTAVCTLPSTCEHVQGCNERKICTSLVARVTFVERPRGNNDGSSSSLTTTTTYDVSSITLTAKYRGSAYQGERTYLDDQSTCRQWFTLDGTEYECNSCTLCEGGVNLDCSNIQPNAINYDRQSGCTSSSTTMTPPSSTFTFWEYCPEEGVPEPTSPGYPAVPSSSGANDTPSATMGFLDPIEILTVTGVIALVLLFF